MGLKSSSSGDSDKQQGGSITAPKHPKKLSSSSSNSNASSNNTSTHKTNENSDTKQNNHNNTNSTSSNNTKNSGSSKSSGIDAHPYSRGSVIEVLWGVKNYAYLTKSGSIPSTNPEQDSDFSDLEDINEDISDHDNDSKHKSIQSKGIPRLCDIIDRAQDHKYPNHNTPPSSSEPPIRWKYYVHYRDFNRRMDEWITCDRILCPPSVGAAKLKALSQPPSPPPPAPTPSSSTQRNQRAPRTPSQSTIKRKREDDDHPTKKKKRKDDDRQKRLLAEIGVSTTDAMVNKVLMSKNGDEPAGPRLTRRQKRKSMSMDHDSNNSSGTTSASGGGNNNAASASTGTNEGTGAGTSGNTATNSISNTSSGTSTSANNTTAGGSNHSERTISARAVQQKVGVDVVATVEAEELDEHEGLDEASLREHEEVTKVKNVSEVQIGKFRMETWYFSPIPKELMKDGNVEVLYCCEFTLNFFTRKKELLRFQSKPGLRRYPPGNEIYRNRNLSMFEVDGFQERIYCQNLCYIAKLFLDHKTLYFDVDPFLFYVLCEVDNRGFHPVGYFSKEKYSDVGYNLACILTFPCHQRKGYGRFLISFSYELSKKEEKVGSPEKPMSDLGQKAYIPYWTSTMVDFLRNQLHEDEMGNISIMDMAKRTSIMAEDIIFTFNQLGILKFINGVYFIAAEPSLLEKLAQKHPVKEPRVDPTKLHWTPYLTDIKRDKFSIYSKKPSVVGEEPRGSGGF